MDPQPQFNKYNSPQTTVYAFQWTWSLEMSHLVIISLSNIEQTTSHLSRASRAWQDKSLELFPGSMKTCCLWWPLWENTTPLCEWWSSFRWWQFELTVGDKKKQPTDIIVGQSSNKRATEQINGVFPCFNVTKVNVSVPEKRWSNPKKTLNAQFSFYRCF